MENNFIEERNKKDLLAKSHLCFMGLFFFAAIALILIFNDFSSIPETNFKLKIHGLFAIHYALLFLLFLSATNAGEDGRHFNIRIEIKVILYVAYIILSALELYLFYETVFHSYRLWQFQLVGKMKTKYVIYFILCIISSVSNVVIAGIKEYNKWGDQYDLIYFFAMPVVSLALAVLVPIVIIVSIVVIIKGDG